MFIAYDYFSPHGNAQCMRITFFSSIPRYETHTSVLSLERDFHHVYTNQAHDHKIGVKSEVRYN